MRDRYEEFTSRGVQVAAVGMGTPAMAADFKREYDVPFLVLIDHTKETYRLVGLKRATLADAVKPKVLLRGALALIKRGQALPQQDPAQLGGAPQRQHHLRPPGARCPGQRAGRRTARSPPMRYAPVLLGLPVKR